jgi:hypothetical protein
MGLLNWILGRRKRHELPIDRQDLKIQLVPKAFDPDGDETDLMWYGLVFEKSGGQRLPYDAPELQERGVMVFNVTGVKHRSKALQMPCFDPPSFLRLVLENDNQFDSNAVAIYDESGQTMVGYVPREMASVIREAMVEHPSYGAMAIAHAKKGERRVSPLERGVVSVESALAGRIAQHQHAADGVARCR